MGQGNVQALFGFEGGGGMKIKQAINRIASFTRQGDPVHFIPDDGDGALLAAQTQHYVVAIKLDDIDVPKCAIEGKALKAAFKGCKADVLYVKEEGPHIHFAIDGDGPPRISAFRISSLPPNTATPWDKFKEVHVGDWQHVLAVAGTADQKDKLRTHLGYVYFGENITVAGSEARVAHTSVSAGSTGCFVHASVFGKWPKKKAQKIGVFLDANHIWLRTDDEVRIANQDWQIHETSAYVLNYWDKLIQLRAEWEKIKLPAVPEDQSIFEAAGRLFDSAHVEAALKAMQPAGNVSAYIVEGRVLVFETVTNTQIIAPLFEVA